MMLSEGGAAEGARPKHFTPDEVVDAVLNLAAVLGALVVGWWASRAGADAPRARARRALEAIARKEGDRVDDGEFHFEIPVDLDIRRQAQLVLGKPTDHAGEVIVRTRSDFDLNETIFKTLPTGPAGFLPRNIVAHRLGVDLFWDDHVAVRVQRAFNGLKRAPKHDQAILDFMRDKCNFDTEHADGSFLDHLQFCYEYGASYYREHSPRVLFLHSILGVGTNIFPMEKKHEPELASMLTPDEMRQIAAFPSILRLLASYVLIDELKSTDTDALGKIERIDFHRVIDNEKMSLTGDELWVQLNYQLIHLLDFLPVAHWGENADDLFLQQFVPLHATIKRARKLGARIDFDVTDAADQTPDGRPMSLAKFIGRAVPAGVKRGMAAKSIRRFSDKCGHCLDYQITWRE